ncbi:PBP1A family penicillin-binding protein [Nitrospira sp. Kam-Ns4a]
MKPLSSTGGTSRWRLAVAGVLAAALLLYSFFLWLTVELPTEDARRPLLMYAAPTWIGPGTDLASSHLATRLARLGYRRVPRDVRAPGEYRLTPAVLDLYLRTDPSRAGPAEPVRLSLDGERVARLSTLPLDEELPSISLEPELLSGLEDGARQVRRWRPRSAFPEPVVAAVLAAEDHRFYAHIGVDPLAIARALLANLRHGAVRQGGSTITQQLAKNLYYGRQRTLARKVQDSLAALILERKYGKDHILEAYLNEIYLGQIGPVAIYGMAEAAERYFGKPVETLTLPEAALLAGMIKAPNTYSPLRDKRLAVQRRNQILQRLRELGWITEPAYRAAVTTPLRLAPRIEGLAHGSHFLDYVLHLVEATQPTALSAGARIDTTLDPVLQQLAEEAVAQGLARLEARFPALRHRAWPLEGALVALDPRRGHLLAMVGGRDYAKSQFNRAVQARRQAGSLLKPFVYLAAFEAGLEAPEGAVTPATLVSDTPISFDAGPVVWSPQNYDRQFHGEVTVRTALEQSLNVPAVRVAQTVGLKRLVALLRALGLTAPLEENLALALGAAEVSLLEITAAYGALAQGGLYVAPTGLQAIRLPTGEPLLPDVQDRRQAVSPQAAYLVTALLKGVVDRGTAAGARTLGLASIVAGKTGTTDGERDAWFVGYTPALVIGVWVGFDDGTPLHLTGAQAALPIWVAFARRVLPPDSADFPVPAGIVARNIDPASGQLATAGCPEAIEEVFIEGTEPKDYCPLHGRSFWDRLRRSLGL